MVKCARGDPVTNPVEPDLPSTIPFALADGPAIGGILKERPEDFCVDEIPAYAPSGAGEHLYVRFEKTGLDTKEAVRRIARALGVEPRDAGFAGLKDRHAITTQWASFHRGDRARLDGASIDGVRVIAAELHENKLRTGHLRGNRFRVRLRGASSAELPLARERLERLASHGVPNFFGEQRFGRDRDNAARARAWIVEGGRPPREPFERKLLVSAWQADLFNQICSERVRDGSWCSVIDGDLCKKQETGGMFVSADLEVDRERAERFEISATGPMFGASMRWPEREALRREEETLARAGITDRALLSRFAKAGEGTRRPYRVELGSPEIEADADGLVLAFDLPSGAYATVALREITRSG